jgi:hypothetical protein
MKAAFDLILVEAVELEDGGQMIRPDTSKDAPDRGRIIDVGVDARVRATSPATSSCSASTAA